MWSAKAAQHMWLKNDSERYNNFQCGLTILDAEAMFCSLWPEIQRASTQESPRTIGWPENIEFSDLVSQATKVTTSAGKGYHWLSYETVINTLKATGAWNMHYYPKESAMKALSGWCFRLIIAKSEGYIYIPEMKENLTELKW